MDSLKQSIRNLGNLFKKAGTVMITVNGIAGNDNNLIALIQNVQRTTGVKKIKNSYQQNMALLDVSYKGKASDLWQNVPQSSKQMFSVISMNDTLINLNYKYASTASAQSENNAVNVTQQSAQANETSIVNTNSNAAKQSQLSKGAALLFKNVKTKLSDQTKNVLFNTINFKLSKDGKQFILDDEAAEFPFDAFVYPTDMNKDGKEEIFILFGNSYTSGMTGSSIVVFIADKAGAYKMNLGFPGTLPDGLATANLGYNDLLVGGPGFEFPVWRWNGKEYVFSKTVKDSDYEKLKKSSVEDISKAYTASF
jgi:hypothetical protein